MSAGIILWFRGGYLQSAVNIHHLQRINLYVFSDPVIISLVPPTAQNVHMYMKKYQTLKDKLP